jgi:hypothetical protein
MADVVVDLIELLVKAKGPNKYWRERERWIDLLKRFGFVHGIDAVMAPLLAVFVVDGGWRVKDIRFRTNLNEKKREWSRCLWKKVLSQSARRFIGV